MGLFSFLLFIFVYIGLPIAVIFLLIWIYQMKKNTDYQVEQNNKIIQMLEDIQNERL